jgi:hypothetical protein
MTMTMTTPPAAEGRFEVHAGALPPGWATQVPHAVPMADPSARGLRTLGAGKSCEMSMLLATAVL